MSSKKVPTHIITGFLGVGKTTAILNLLAQKPAGEKWAVLVNEFGEIGVDGSILEGQNLAKSEIAVKEVPGGCMCCASGLPMQIALNQLIAFAKPTRLFIEPTGLGHPEEVVQALKSEHYKDVLDLRRIITLIDARKASQSRYTEHPTFVEQISIADLIVANKSDLYSPEDSDNLRSFLNKIGKGHTEQVTTVNGDLSLEHILGTSVHNASDSGHHTHDHADVDDHEHEHNVELAADKIIPDTGFIRSDNQGENFHSVGWRFSSDVIFNRESLVKWMHGIDVERLKAVVITDSGIAAYNISDQVLTESLLDESAESRIEIIASERSDQWETELLDCRL